MPSVSHCNTAARSVESFKPTNTSNSGDKMVNKSPEQLPPIRRLTCTALSSVRGSLFAH